MRLLFWLSMTAVVGCAADASSTIPAHDYSAEVVIDGSASTATLAFPSHDAASKHHDGDATCQSSQGDCGSDAPTYAKISGDAPIASAWMATPGGDVKNATYYVEVLGDGMQDATCIVSVTFGQPVPCEGVSNIMVTLTPAP